MQFLGLNKNEKGISGAFTPWIIKIVYIVWQFASFIHSFAVVDFAVLSDNLLFCDIRMHLFLH